MGYGHGFAGAAGADYAQDMMAQEIKRRMFEATMAQQQQEQARLGQQAQQGFDLDRQRLGQQQSQFDVSRQDELAAAQAEQEKAAADAAAVEGLLGQIPQGPAQTLGRLKARGISGLDIHNMESPEAHQAHVAEEEAAGLADFTKRQEIQGQIGAKYRAPRDERTVQVMGPEGTPIWVRESDAIGKPAAQAPRAVTGQERQTLAYYNRAKEAMESVEGLEQEVAGSGLMGQAQLQYAPNMMQTAAQQQYRQAQRAFTEARLRKESGAAIPTAEYENDARTYFAQPGDAPEVIAQKKAARQTVLEGMRNASGKAYNEFYGDDAAAPQRPSAQSSSGGPAVGTVKKFPNGKTGVWDGKGWVAQ